MNEIIKNIYQVQVPLPGSPLKILNSYIIKGKDRHLLVDVGYNADESENAIKDAFDELGLKLEDTDIFLTHLHGDHTGCIERLKHVCQNIYISKFDGDAVNRTMTLEYWMEVMAVQEHMGIPQGQELPYLDHPGHRGGVTTYMELKTVNDGDLISVGDYTFEVINLKGHTPGLKGLYEKNEKILICGDHIINKITPNINSWDFENDYLGFFLDNLIKVRAMKLKFVLPGHRTIITDHVTRINELIAHHEKRLKRIIEVLSEGEKTIYDVSMRVEWDFGGGFFGDFPNEQKWFAGNEVFAHLEHLRVIGKVDYTVRDNTFFYYLM